MFNGIIRFALRYRPLIVALSLVCLVYGGYLTTKLPIDVFPDLDRPRVVLITECPGLSAKNVENLVSAPLEASVLGATGVEDVRSQSTTGLSVIYVEFGWDADVHKARQVVQERLAAVQAELPPGIRPQMAPISSLMGQIVYVGMYHRPGPSGGELAPVGNTGLLAELHCSAGGGVTLSLWEPKPRNEPARWRTVVVDDRQLSLSWEGSSSEGGGSVVLRPVPNRPGSFAGHSPALARLTAAEFTSRGRRARITVARVSHLVVFESAEKRQMALRTTADWVVRPRLRKVPGVAQVMASGGGRKQFQVLADPRALREYDVTLHQLEEAVRRANPSASGGVVENSDRERPVVILSHLGPDAARAVLQLRKAPVKVTPTRVVLVEHVAQVVEGPQSKRGDASVNGQPGVVLTVTKQPHADTRAVTDLTVAALAETEATLPAHVVLTGEIFQLKRFIDLGITNIAEALGLGAVMVLIILFLFLLNFRTTLISLTAIPLSLVVTTLAFRWIGALTGTTLSINVMTLGGIAVAIGELVDDAVVDVENIFRRLRENHASAEPRPDLRVVLEASIEVRGAIVFSTGVVILVFLPLFALSGVEGRLFAPLAVAYIVSILASLLVSLTVTPVLSSYLLPRSGATHRTQDSPLLRLLKWLVTPLVRLSMAHAGKLLLLTWLLVGLAAWRLTRLGTEFLPEFDEGTIQINVTMPPGFSLQTSNERCDHVDALLRKLQKSESNPDGPVLFFARRSGRAELDEEVEPVTNSEYIVTMNPAVRQGREETLKQLLQQLKDEVPDADIEVEQPLSHLMNHMLSGVKAQIAIKVFGDDLGTLRQTARKVRDALRDVPGLTPPVIEEEQEVEEIQIRFLTEALAFHGIDRAALADFLQTSLKGEVVSQVIEGQRRFDLVVRLDERFRGDLLYLRGLRVPLPDGRGAVDLGELVRIEQGYGPVRISRDDGRRRIAIRCNALGRDLGSVVADVQQRVGARVAMPEGYSIEYGGQFESQQRAARMISLLAVASVVGMFLVLYMLFPSARVVLQVLNALPTAFVGGVLALVLTDQRMSVASMVGFISLGGIAARNGILLVTHYVHLMKHEGEGFTQAMIVRGSLERLAPVLMTALTAGIALVPIVLGGRAPGREILYPVATVILGGLATSTFCEFLIHPGLFWRFSGKDAERLLRAEDQ